MKNVFLLFLTLASLSVQAINGNKQVLTDTLKVTEKNVIYNVFEDNTYVYLTIITSDKNTSMALLRNGLTVYFDIKGKEKKDVYIKYPYKAMPRQPSQSRQKPDDNDGNTRAIDFTEIIENMPDEVEYGYYDEVQQFHKDLNTQDISLNYSANKEILEFSIKIPKNRINSNKKVDFSKLSIGVLSNKLERNPKNDRENARTPSQGDRKRGGNRGGSGRNGGKKPGGRGQKGIKGGDVDAQKERITIDFWFDANLKNK